MSLVFTGSRHGPIAPMSSQAELAPGHSEHDGTLGRIRTLQPVRGVGDVRERRATLRIAQADRAGRRLEVQRAAGEIEHVVGRNRGRQRMRRHRLGEIEPRLVGRRR